LAAYGAARLEFFSFMFTEYYLIVFVLDGLHVFVRGSNPPPFEPDSFLVDNAVVADEDSLQSGRAVRQSVELRARQMLNHDFY
jgi:hypothetical protein